MKIIIKLLVAFYSLAKKHTKTVTYGVIAIIIAMFVGLAIGKTYQHLDNDEQRGAIAIQDGAFNEDYTQPVYLDQGWAPSDSLWFYNTTQGSNLLPYDFFLVLEEPQSEALFRSDELVDKYRYLPQKATFFNPDGLPVGFVKDNYDGKDYVGYTCAACHTAQVNYKGKAIRIDGGPAMADMVGFLRTLESALRKTKDDPKKRERFVEAVIEVDNDYDSEEEVLADLDKWLGKRQEYNLINHSKVDYGYARLDAFGRIYNRVLQHIINKEQLKELLLTARKVNGERMLTLAQVDKVLDGIDKTIIGNNKFSVIVNRLLSKEDGYPGMSVKDVLRLRNQVFNEPNAPVSYPFLWDTAHSDYVQWNGLASNASAGPLGRNAGEVTGVFATLDWSSKSPWYARFSIPAIVSGQDKMKKVINFKSSVDLVNLQRLESQLKSLRSPSWPEEILGKIDQERKDRGRRLFEEYCVSCHEVVNTKNWDRLVVAQMSSLDIIQTDPAMAENSVFYKGKSGNFKHTYQDRTGVGKIVMEEEAPVAMILTAATAGVVATPDADKWWLRRTLDWFYVIGMSFFDNDIEDSVKNGNYNPDTAAKPFDSLLAYKARPLNGIWATAPYLHNGSVPSLYELLLPVKREGDPDDGEYRPNEFVVGSREFDPVNVGFKSSGYDGFKFVADRRGNFNTGHEYAAGITPRPDGKVLPPLGREERLDLVEFMKSL